MKRRFHSLWGAFLALVVTHTGASLAPAQDGSIILPPPPYPPTVVTVDALDAVATEPGDPAGTIADVRDPAVFVVHRHENLHLDLPVYYRLEGSAVNGEDYERLSGEVVIPAGARVARVVVSPLADNLDERVEEVRITLLPPVCIAIYPPPPECYVVGRPGSALAYIRDSEEIPVNHPPRAEIVRPVGGDVFKLGETIPVEVVTRDPDGYAPRVVLHADGVAVAEASIEFIVAPPPGEPIQFTLEWTGAPPGPHVLQALATDNEGAEGWSDPVRIFVDGLPDVPEVNVVATDPVAAEPEPVPDGMLRPIILDSGTFTVSRKGGNQEESLTVYFLLGGTASNGIDYERIPWSVTLPAGATEATVEVVPIDDDLPEGKETVDLLLIHPPYMDPVLAEGGLLPGFGPMLLYRIGAHDRDTVVITDDDSDHDLPPRVAIVRPETGSVFVAPATIGLVAQAGDLDGEVVQVEFFANGRSLGLGSAAEPMNLFLGGRLFHLAWPDVEAGGYRLTAVATDNDGLGAESEPVDIKVVEDPPFPGDIPVVHIRARDPVGSESGHFVGTPTITFQVSRHGSTDEPLLVFFRIGGSAINGQDYERIPMMVTIPAGFESAEVWVRPIDDGISERPESVVLSLILPPTNDPAIATPPPYFIGRPARAAALIFDDDRLHAHCLRLDDGTFHLCHSGDGSHCFRIEVSEDMRHWEVLGEQSVADGGLHFVDPDGALHPRRFYRVVPIPCPEWH